MIEDTQETDYCRDCDNGVQKICKDENNVESDWLDPLSIKMPYTYCSPQQFFR